MNAELKTMPTFRVLALEHRGPYHLIGDKFGELMGVVGSMGIPLQSVLGVYYDDPHSVAAEDLRSDACVGVPDDFELPDGYQGELRIKEIQGGDYAFGTHLGPYAGLGDAWAQFDTAAKALGRAYRPEPCFEMYMNDCTQVAPEEIRTDLYSPLECIEMLGLRPLALRTTGLRSQDAVRRADDLCDGVLGNSTP